MKDIKTFTETSEDIKKLTGSKRERAEDLLRKAEFQSRELAKLQEALAEKGWVEIYQNGANQHGLKKSSEGEVYISLSKNYLATIKQINDMIPDSAEKVDEFTAFLDAD